MSLRIFLTVLHDLIIFNFSFFLALLLRLELQPALDLFSMLWVYSVGFSIMNIIILHSQNSHISLNLHYVHCT